MSEYLKLTEPGTSHTFVVKTVTVITTGKWPDLHFLTERGEIVVAPKAALDRELAKMKLTDWQQTVGMALTVSRSTKIGANGNPFWDCAMAAGGYAVEPNRPSLVQAAKEQAELIRKAKNLPPDDGGSMGPHIPGLDDVPPPTDADSPYGDEDGMPPVKATTHPKGGISLKETEINAAYDRAWNFALNVQGGIATVETVENAAVTLLIQYAQSGLFRG